MADLLLQTHYVMSSPAPPGVPYAAGQYIRVIADGAAIRAELWTAPTGGMLIATPSGGPALSGDPGGYVISAGGFNNPQYCDGEDLVYYTPKITWPYADHHVSVDHPSCAILVCDLQITGYTTTNETAVGAGNGTIALTATSSNGNIKFSLTPGFDYGDGVDSPISGLSTGNYVVYAKDESGCTDQINVFIGIDYTYGPKWRLEYDHVHPVGYVSRIDIEQRDYTGEVEEVCGGGTPFLQVYESDEDSQIVHSNATIQLLVDVEGKFNDIREGDDRQHVVKKYINPGSGFVLEWVGYVTPEFYEEPYLFEPYIISIKAIDGLGELKSKIFQQDSGDQYFGSMSVIKIIAACLKKLPVNLPLRSCVNIFEENMDSDPGDDPLAQVFIKTENYRGNNCDEVVTKLIKPFTGAELFQSNGGFWIRTREQSVYTTLPYREFDKDGEYVDDDTITPRVSLGFPSHTTRMCWIEASQRLHYDRPYGKFIITHQLDKDNNMTDSGGFEVEDINPSTEFFYNWTLFPLQAGLSAGMEYVDNGESKGAFFAQWPEGGISNQALNALASDIMPLSIGEDFGTGNVFENSSTVLTLKFQVYVSPNYNVPWIWLGWKLRYTDVDSGEFWEWWPPTGSYSVRPPEGDSRINDVYVTEYNAWKTYEYNWFRFPGTVFNRNYTVQVIFYFHDHKGRDFSSYTTLRGVPTEMGTNPSIEGKKIYYGVTGANSTIEYTLQKNTESEDSPRIIRPDDYHAVSNPLQWVKTNEFNVDLAVPLLQRILIDNVSISIFPITPNLEGPGVFLIDPPETVTYEETVTDRNESVMDVEVFNGDAPPLVGAEYIYNGFFTREDKTLTKLWYRDTVHDERQKLLGIYLGYLSAQGTKAKRLLSGSGLADIQVYYINSLVDVIDNRKYRFTRFEFDDKEGKYTFSLEETLTGPDGETPPGPPDVEGIGFDYELNSIIQ